MTQWYYADHNRQQQGPVAAAEVARLLASYNLVSLPVVDDAHHLVGVVSVDDVLDYLLPEDWRSHDSDDEGAASAASTTGSGTPATTCALVTTRSGATTNPLPDWFCPHANAVPLMRATDLAAAASGSDAVSTSGGSWFAAIPPSASSIVGRPCSKIADRTRARPSATGPGVSRSIVLMTTERLTA